MASHAQAVPTPLTAEEEAFVRAFGRAIITVPRAVDADLLHEQGMSLSEYTVLMHLSEAPGQRLRMGDLASRCALSLSGMTRIVGRLESHGAVRRERCCSDGRGWNAVLTDTGLNRLRRAWPAHLASVRRHMIDHLHGLDLPTLTAAVQRFAAGSGHEPGESPGTPCSDEEHYLHQLCARAGIQVAALRPAVHARPGLPRRSLVPFPRRPATRAQLNPAVNTRPRPVCCDPGCPQPGTSPWPVMRPAQQPGLHEKKLPGGTPGPASKPVRCSPPRPVGRPG
jgi:DNA-binding MarR family transcriptional regulator